MACRLEKLQKYNADEFADFLDGDADTITENPAYSQKSCEYHQHKATQPCSEVAAASKKRKAAE